MSIESTKTPAPAAASPVSDADTESRKATGWKMTIILALCLLVMGGALALAHYHTVNAAKKGPSGRPAEQPPVPVVTATVARKDMPVYLTGIGTVQAYNTVTVRPRVDGEITKIAFTEGQDVKAGDLLAQIDPDPYRAALAQVTAKKGQDEAQLANARVDLKRYADLLANEGVTQQQYDTQQALVNQLIATVNADQAAIDSAKVLLGYTTITSPIDGRTGIRLVDQGNIVRANDANGIVVITQLKPISVVFTLPEQALSAIHEEAHGVDPALPVIAISQGDTHVLGEGKLAVIDNQIDPTSRQFKLKATFQNADLRLWPGQFVNARLLLKVRKGCTVVSTAVIQRGPEGPFVFVVKDDQTVEVRPVKVAPALPQQVEEGEVVIESGLSPDEQVVSQGQFKLQAGSRVKVADGSKESETGSPKPEGQSKGKGKKRAAL